GGLVTIKTPRVHGFADNDTVLISGVGSPGYDGVFLIKKIDANTLQYNVAPAKGLAPSGNGTAINYSEWMRLFNLKYGGYAAGDTVLPSSFGYSGKFGAWYSPFDFDGLDTDTRKSTVHFFTGFKVNSINPVTVPAGAPQVLPMTITPATGTT